VTRRPEPRAKPATPLAKVRELCLALPEVTERPSHGAPTFFYKQNVLCYFVDNHHGDGRLALWLPAASGAQAMLVDSDPEIYFVPPYVGYRGWIGVRLDRGAPWSQIAALIESAHDEVATRKKVRR
jgi:hypothetical protein